MRHSKFIYALLLSLMAAGLACAGGKSVTTVAAAPSDVQTQSATAAVQSFNSVEGTRPDVQARFCS